jgi:RNA polymerase sigma-32 factor
MKQPAKKKKPEAVKPKANADRNVRSRKTAEPRLVKAVKASPRKKAAKPQTPKVGKAPVRTAAAGRPALKSAPKASPRPAARPVPARKPAAPKDRPRAADAAKAPVPPRPAPIAGKPAKKEAKPVKPTPATPAAEAPATQPEAPPAAKKPAAKRPAKKEPKASASKSSKSKKDDDSEKALVKFDPLQRYLSEISKYRLLTRDEERDYGIRVKEQGDKDAAYALVTANLRLVVKIALEFQRVWMQNLLDLIQEGNIGLMQAVKKFDPYKNVKFSYYASFWIKAYILKFIMDNWRLVKIGTTQGQRKLFFKLKKEKQRLIDQGFDPKPKLLSERLGVSEREIVDMDQRLDGWDVSLDAPLKNDSETERIEFLSTDAESVEEQVSKKEIELLLHNKISEFRKKMSPREVEIFELRIFSDNPVTLQEIGDRYGISRERVRQIEKNIIRKMRDFFKREIPDFASYSEDTGME